MYGSFYGSFDGGAVNGLRQLESELDQILERWAPSTGIRSPGRGAFPPVNVGFTADRVDVSVFAAGLDPKSIDVTVQQNLLVLSGRRGIASDDTADYYRKERFEGEFRRVITLPDDVDVDKVAAKYRDGVLHVTVQRREAARPRQISVQ
jgi:HSP20 family protein